MGKSATDAAATELTSDGDFDPLLPYACNPGK